MKQQSGITLISNELNFGVFASYESNQHLDDSNRTNEIIKVLNTAAKVILVIW